VKAWQRERMATFISAIGGLTLVDLQEIERVCEAEKQHIRSLPTIPQAFPNSPSFKRPMTDARKMIRETLQVNADNSNAWFNPKLGKWEHIILKYLNWEDDEWHAMNGQPSKRLSQRKKVQQILDDPYGIVDKAEELLSSSDWKEVAIGLGVVTGRRLGEVCKSGELKPHTMYTAIFSGQLKRKDRILKPFEIPLLLPSSVVVPALVRLRSLVDLSGVEDISKAYGTELAATITQHFAELIPVWEGFKGLSFKFFRAVYPTIAINWFCPVEVPGDTYASTILGHWWEDEDGDIENDYAATLHYTDYAIGDGASNIDGRHGTRLQENGVTVLEVFQEKSEESKPQQRKGKRTVPTQNKNLELVEKPKAGRSLYNITSEIKADFDRIQKERGLDSEKAVAALVIAEYDILQAIRQACGDDDIDTLLAALQVARKESNKPVTLLHETLKNKQTQVAAYRARVEVKNYGAMATSELVRHKTVEAAKERYKRGVDALIAYNLSVSPELRWFINATVLVELVGGAPAGAKEYIESRSDVAAHHKQLGLKGNRRIEGVTVKGKVPVPEHVTNDAPVENS